VRLTLDTNILIAAFVARGVCHELLEHCERHHAIISSEFILNEFETKLLRKFKLPSAKAAAVVALVRSRCLIIDPAELREPACRDPDDDWVLATAVEGECACIVTGDKDLLVLREYAGILILPPQAFWTFEAEHSSIA
jgi:uncharacterized protein